MLKGDAVQRVHGSLQEEIDLAYARLLSNRIRESGSSGRLTRRDEFPVLNDSVSNERLAAIVVNENEADGTRAAAVARSMPIRAPPAPLAALLRAALPMCRRKLLEEMYCFLE